MKKTLENQIANDSCENGPGCHQQPVHADAHEFTAIRWELRDWSQLIPESRLRYEIPKPTNDIERPCFVNVLLSKLAVYAFFLSLNSMLIPMPQSMSGLKRKMMSKLDLFIRYTQAYVQSSLRTLTTP
jgi:hypothetical protein